MSSTLRRLLENTRAKANRALNGLYHGKIIRYGNQISHSDRKTRRRWEPNVQKKSYYSEILDERIDVKIVTRAMRTVDKYYGFDNYIVLTHPRFLEGLGMKLKERMLDTLRAKPEAAFEDYLNVSPECWDYLKTWDEKVAAKEDKAATAAAEAEAEQIAKEKAQKEGTWVEPKKKKKSIKQFFIEKRIANRERSARKRMTKSRYVHGRDV